MRSKSVRNLERTIIAVGRTLVRPKHERGTDVKEARMHGYLIDMDGVIYRGNHLIPGAELFIQKLRVANVPFRFLTNNSQRTRRDVAKKLQRMGIDVEE